MKQSSGGSNRTYEARVATEFSEFEIAGTFIEPKADSQMPDNILLIGIVNCRKRQFAMVTGVESEIRGLKPTCQPPLGRRGKVGPEPGSIGCIRWLASL
jgi:hypothetical protein